MLPCSAALTGAVATVRAYRVAGLAVDLHELCVINIRAEGGYPNRLHQWLSEDIGDPMLATHMHAVLMFQRLAIANGYGWKRFLHMVDQVLPRKGNTLELPLELTDSSER